MAVKKQRGLGRGLSALLGDDLKVTVAADSAGSVTEIDLTQLIPGKYQPRTQWEMDRLRELSDSIKEQGVISPIIVRAVSGGKFEIIAGERRFRASKMAGKMTIPALIRSVNDKDALAMALIENMQREDLNAMEEALGVKRLIEEFNYTHEDAAKALGRSRSATTNLLRLLNLTPTVQDMLLEGRLEMGHARALLSLEGAAQIQAAQEIALKGLTVREAEKIASEHKGVEKRKSIKKVSRKTRDDINFEESLSEAIGAPVEIEYGRRSSGKILISFANFDDLQAIADKLLAKGN